MEVHHFECDTTCGFKMEGFSKEEVASLAMIHMKSGHPQVSATETMIDGIITTEERAE